MKNTLYLFGDSYISPANYKHNDKVLKYKSWPDLVADKLQLNQTNFGIAGSSIEYSMNKFYEVKNTIKNGDFVIFSFSATGRLDLKYTELKPHTSWFSKRIWETPWNISMRPQHIDYIWMRDNLDYIQWFVNNRNSKTYDINQLAFTHMLKSFAEDNPSINILVLYMLKPVLEEKINNLPSNITINNDFYLLDIAESEIMNGDMGDMFETYVIDPRINHLTKPNRDILAKYVLDKLMQVDTNITKQTFKTKIFKVSPLLNDYKNAVSDGIIDYIPLFQNILEYKSKVSGL